MSRIIAKCPSTKKILLGGLGCLGVGVMFVDEADYVNREDFASAPSFDTEEECMTYEWRLLQDTPEEAKSFVRAMKSTLYLVRGLLRPKELKTFANAEQIAGFLPIFFSREEAEAAGPGKEIEEIRLVPEGK